MRPTFSFGTSDAASPRALFSFTCDIQMIKMAGIDTAYERLLKGDAKFRFVIDMATLKEAA